MKCKVCKKKDCKCSVISFEYFLNSITLANRASLFDRDVRSCYDDIINRMQSVHEEGATCALTIFKGFAQQWSDWWVAKEDVVLARGEIMIMKGKLNY